MSNKTVCIALMLVALGFPRVASSIPVFQGIGLLPGATAGSATDISGDGRVVVGTLVSPDGTTETYRRRNGAIENLGRLAGARNTFGLSASNNGATIVGLSDYVDGRNVASRWRDGSWVPLEAGPAGVVPDRAIDVSSDGSVIVGRIGWNTAAEPFRWTAGITTPLGASGEFQNAVAPYAAAISGDGSRIAIQSARTSLTDDGFALWDDGSFIQIDGLNATAISTDGAVVVGNSFVGPGASEFEASLWSERTGVKPLGRLAGFGFSQALGASGDGSVIVGAVRRLTSGGTATGPISGFIWDANGGLRSIDDYITLELMLDISGWTLNEVVSVSDDGTKFVGNGVSPSGVSQGWILVVPEPSTAILLSFGLVILGTHPRRWRERSLDAVQGSAAFPAG